jgi:hypothetical protein
MRTLTAYGIGVVIVLAVQANQCLSRKVVTTFFARLRRAAVFLARIAFRERESCSQPHVNAQGRHYTLKSPSRAA